MPTWGKGVGGEKQPLVVHWLCCGASRSGGRAVAPQHTDEMVDSAGDGLVHRDGNDDKGMQAFFLALAIEAAAYRVEPFSPLENGLPFVGLRPWGCELHGRQQVDVVLPGSTNSPISAMSKAVALSANAMHVHPRIPKSAANRSWGERCG